MTRTLRPHPGRQQLFVESRAEIAIFGGLAGCGKTGGLLFQPAPFLAHRVPASCIFFRRTDQEIDIPGGFADAARSFYAGTGARVRQSPRDFTWKVDGGAVRVMLHSLVKESQVDEYYGAELDLIAFDEVQYFTEHQFFHLATRRRSKRKPGKKQVKPFVRATCNPVWSGWLRRLVDWYIGSDGFAIEERVGAIRWFAVIPTEEEPYHLEWADSEQELLQRYPRSKPMSFTFLQGRREDNPTLDWEDYDKSTANQPLHVQRALGEGNWNARPADPALIYHMPSTAIYTDVDADFVRFVETSRSVQLYGAWDYGRGLHGLSWGLGALQGGSLPTFWLLTGRVWTATRAEQAAADRAAAVELLDVPLDIGTIRECGDPAGWSRGADDDGWARMLQTYDVPLMDVRASYTKDRQRVIWNSAAGFKLTTDLVNHWLATGRLRIRDHPTTRPILDSLREWRLSIPEGVDPVTVNRELIPPDKGVHSHPGDMLRYLVAFVAQMIAADVRADTGPTSAPPVASPMRSRGFGRGSRW